MNCSYGSTKCGLRQLQASLLKECKQSKVGVHTASPGMVLTDLLLRYCDASVFCIVCINPAETNSLVLKVTTCIYIKKLKFHNPKQLTFWSSYAVLSVCKGACFLNKGFALRNLFLFLLK